MSPDINSGVQTGIDAATGLRFAIATAKDVHCPNPDCGGVFEINPWFYDTVAECPECGGEFVIRPPPAPSSPLDRLPPNHPARQRKQSGMRSSAELPPAIAMPDPPLLGKRRPTVACPLCNRAVPVSESKADSSLECLACGCVFPSGS